MVLWDLVFLIYLYSTYLGIFMDTDLMATQLPLMLEEWQSTTGWQPGAVQLLQFQNFFDLVCLANKSLNLTRILEPVDFWEKHLWDSLQPILTKPVLTRPELQEVYKVIDLGTGGGFPGLPIAIAYPDWAVTVMDSTAKKISFIESGLATLELTFASRGLSTGYHSGGGGSSGMCRVCGAFFGDRGHCDFISGSLE
jgi:hypothetical protein